MATRRKACSLLRVSTDQQTKQKDLDYQRNQIRFTCVKFNLEIVEEFSLNDISGMVVNQTDEFRRLKQMLSKGDISGLVIPGVDRLARTTDFETVADLMRPFSEMLATGKNTKRLWTRTAELDITNAADRDKIWQDLRRAEEEREMIKFRTSQQKDVLRTDSHTKIDKLPRGVIEIPISGQKKRYNFKYDPEIKRKIVEACKRVLAGEALSDIAVDLGYHSGGGLRETLRSEWWIGNKTRLKTRKERRFDPEKQKYIAGGRLDHENPIRTKTNLADAPAVSKEVWDAVQVKVDENHNQHTQRRSYSKGFLATGLVHCGVCGEKLYHKLQNGRHHAGYFWCASKATSYRKHGIKKGVDCGFGFVRVDVLEPEIALQVMLYLTDKDFIEQHLKEASNAEATEEKKRVLVRVQNEITEVDADKRSMLDAIKKRIATPEDYAGDLKDANYRLESLAAKSTMMRQEINTSLSAATMTRMADQIATEFAKFPYIEFAEKNALMRKYVKKITVKKDEVRDSIALHFDVKPDAPDMKFQADEFQVEPKHKAPPPKDPDAGLPVRVKKASGTIGGVPSRRSKTKGQSTSSSSPPPFFTRRACRWPP